ncbi:MAG: GGDEF domain-containing protein [Aquabacterium sp.]
MAHVWLHLRLWPRRAAPDPVPRETWLVVESIGLSFASLSVAIGLLTTGTTLILLGVLAAGIWLFDRTSMLLGHHSVSVVVVTYDVGVLSGWWPYAPALSPLAYSDPQAMWWLQMVKELIFYCGWSALLMILWAFIGSLDSSTEQLTHESNTDALTGLANRRRFMEVMAAEIERQTRTLSPMCVVLMDADHFKRINDEHGHAVGDQALISLAQVLTQCLRRPTDLAGRLGGEEFALLLPDTSIGQAIDICRQIQQHLARETFGAPGRPLQLTLSFGLVEAGQEAMTDVLKRADAQLYRAKAMGRNRICLPDMPREPA